MEDSLVIVGGEDKNKEKDAIEHNPDIKKEAKQELDVVDKLRNVVNVEEVKEQDESSNVIRGHGWECKTEDEAETLYNSAQFKDEEKVVRLELMATDMTVLRSKGKVQDSKGIVMSVMSSDELH